MALNLWQSGAVVIGCRDNTAEFIDSLCGAGHPISGIVTISRETAARNQVPTWADLDTEFGQRCPVYVASSYSLDSDRDRAQLSAAGGDVGFCIGWQRMLPEWFLERYRNGVYGMHASATRLPDGRGRSPINWGVIEGAELLHAHIFRYNGQPDAGEVLSAPELPIEPHDDIQTLQQKARVIFAKQAMDHWEELVSGTPSLQPVRPLSAADRVYAKRSAADGAIDWSWSAKQITNWVRAQTRPYPGAFTIHDGLPYRVWRCGPAGMEQDAPVGMVLESFRDNTYIVSCGDRGSVHLLDHCLPVDLGNGQRVGMNSDP